MRGIDRDVGATPPVDYLRLIFTTSEDGNTLIWRGRPVSHFRSERSAKIWNTKYAGKPAGYVTDAGYLLICIDYVSYRAHRLLWKMRKGFDSVLDIDHANGNGLDNSEGNLREATRSQNRHNTGAYKCNKTGYKGVFYRKDRGKYVASIRIHGKSKHLGHYDSAEEAHAVYSREAKLLFNNFTNVGCTNAS
jgi:hypothetical protein